MNINLKGFRSWLLIMATTGLVKCYRLESYSEARLPYRRSLSYSRTCSGGVYRKSLSLNKEGRGQ
jgi:hypothetical protein